MTDDATPLSDPPPVRSLLFTPANREQRMRTALTVGADAVVYDLESAIPRGQAEPARALVRDIVGGHEGRPLLFVRVSAVGSDELEGDLAAAVRPGLTGVMLPQVADPAEVATLDTLIGRIERSSGMPPGRVRIWPLVETAQAVRLAYEIAAASPRVAYMGGATSRGGDLARSIGFRFTPGGDETLFLRSKVLIDVRAAGVANPVSGLWGIVDDLDGLSGFCRSTRDLGYEGVMVIHPSHLPVVHEVFTPSPAELAEWRRIVEAMADAEADGVGAIRLDGALVDVAHVHTARRQLERARRLGVT